MQFLPPTQFKVPGAKIVYLFSSIDQNELYHTQLLLIKKKIELNWMISACSGFGFKVDDDEKLNVCCHSTNLQQSRSTCLRLMASNTNRSLGQWEWCWWWQLLLWSLQSGVHRRGAYRDFEDLSLYIRKHLSQSVAACGMPVCGNGGVAGTGAF